MANMYVVIVCVDYANQIPCSTRREESLAGAVKKEKPKKAKKRKAADDDAPHGGNQKKFEKDPTADGRTVFVGNLPQRFKEKVDELVELHSFFLSE